MTTALIPADLTAPCPHESEALAAVARVLAAQDAAGLISPWGYEMDPEEVR